jgi:hypothetical protein
MADLPVLGPDYEMGFICPVCGAHWPQVLYDGPQSMVRVYCVQCRYFTDYAVNNGNN